MCSQVWIFDHFITMNKTTGIVVIIVAVIGLVGLSMYTGNNSNNYFQQNLSNQGAGQQISTGTIANTNNPNAPPSVCPSGQPNCSVTISLLLRDALDLSSADTDVTNAVTTYYKSSDGVKFYAVGASASNTYTIQYDASYNGVLYAGVSVPSGQSFYVAPSATADKNLNPRVVAYDYKDPIGTGTKVWMFKVDMTNLPAPQAGQTSSTIPLTVLLYASGTDSLNSPADAVSVSTTANTATFIRWIDTITADKANAHYEYEIKINTTDTSKWSKALTILSIPNLGDIPLSSFTDTSDGTNEIYKYTLSTDLSKANYVVSPKNGDTAHYFTFKFVTSIGATNHYVVTFTIRSYSSATAGQSANDAVTVTNYAS